MGVATLQALRDELRFGVGGFLATADELPDPRVDRWLGWALLHVSRPSIYSHRELMTSGTFALVASTPSYTLASFGTTTDNVQAIRRVHYETRGHRLRPMSHRQYLEAARRADGTVVTGEPQQYAIDGPSLYVSPAASANFLGTVRVFFFRKPTALAAAGAATELAEDWDEVILAGGVWRAFRALNVADRAELAKLNFGQLVNEVRDRLREDAQQDHDGHTFEVENLDYQENPV